MSIQNTLTKEIMPVEVYKMRCELEDLFGYARGTLRNWTGEQIEYHYGNIMNI